METRIDKITYLVLFQKHIGIKMIHILNLKRERGKKKKLELGLVHK